MPSITIYTSKTHQLDTDSFTDFSKYLVNLSIDLLNAKEDNIHISYNTVEIGFGTKVYFEVKLRKELFRTKEVLNEYINQVDLLIKERIGVVARIRCFFYECNNIYSKN